MERDIDTAIHEAAMAEFEETCLHMIRAGYYGRDDLYAAVTRANGRRIQEVAAATYGADRG